MLIAYLAITLTLYLFAIVSGLGREDTLGEHAAVALCALGLAVALSGPLRNWRYVVALVCACAAPVAAMLAHEVAAAQVWSLIPLMFMAVYVRSWHRPAVARAAALLMAAGAVVALVVSPAQVPPLWLLHFSVTIVGAAEVLGLLHSALLDAALRDPLTSVWNRAGLARASGELIPQARRRGEAVAVIALDIDDFKTVNDRDGHAAGDRVLIDLTHRWTALLPAAAVIGRLGGDEFVAVVPGYDQGRARTLAAVLGEDGPVNVSTGVAVGRPRDARSFGALLAAADRDLYRLKGQRKADP